MTEKERLRAIIGNIKNYDFSVNPIFKIDADDAIVLTKMFKEYTALKIAAEKEAIRQHRYYEENKQKIKDKAKTRYHAKKEGAKNDL